jgi:hypothetical protein
MKKSAVFICSVVVSLAVLSAGCGPKIGSKIGGVDVEGVYVAVLQGMTLEESIALMAMSGNIQAIVIAPNGYEGSAEIDVNGNIIGDVENIDEYTLSIRDSSVILTSSTTNLMGSSIVNMIYDPDTSSFAFMDVELPSGLSDYESMVSPFLPGVTLQRIGSAKKIKMKL